MAKKKRGKKTTSKKVRKAGKKTVQRRLVRSTKRKINLVLRNLILFGVLALISFCLYTFCTNELFRNLFYLLTLIFAFVGLAFLIILLALAILKLMKK